MALDVEKLRKRAAEGLRLTADAEAAVRADDARRAEEQREQAKAKRVTEFLDLEPALRAAAEGARAEVRSAISRLNTVVDEWLEARDKHEAVARALRGDGESCPSIPKIKVESIQDRGLYRDLETLRLTAQRDW